MNSYRRDLRNGVLVNPKLFILEKVNLDPHIKCWSNLVKLSQTWSNVFKLILFGTGHYSLILTPIRNLDYLDLRIENLEKHISFSNSFKLKCNYKKKLYTHNIHSENLENLYKTINTLVDLIINFS